jgi:hypothetical protein
MSSTVTEPTMKVTEAGTTIVAGETRAPYDVYAKLEDPMGVLSVALGQWERRDETRPQPEVRRASNTAMDAIDGMLADLHAMRSRLVGEIRDADDATAARVDALLVGRQLQPHGYDPDSHKPGNSCTYCGRDQDDPLHAPMGEGFTPTGATEAGQ